MPNKNTSFPVMFVFAILFSQITLADFALPRDDFRFSTEISQGKQSLRQFELPYEVLKGLQRQDYGDLRIFNAQKQIVPFTVSVERPRAEQHSSEHELDFFTLPRNPHRSSRLTVEIDQYSKRFHFSTTTKTNSKQRSHIIIKNPYTGKGLHRLKLHWTTPDNAFSLKMKLEQSDDLETWRTVKSQTTLYDLKHGATVLIKDTVFLPHQSEAKYFRLSFQDKHYFLHSVNRITGFYRHQSQPEPENWQTLTLSQGENPREWLFDTQSVAPVSKMAFEIPQIGLFYQGSLFSKHLSPPIRRPVRTRTQLKQEVKEILHHPDSKRKKQHDFWRYRQGFTQYRLLVDSGEITGQPLSLSGIKDNEWRLVLSQPLTLLPEQLPKIRIARYPVLVTFLAQGNGPYTLLFGNADMKPLHSSLPATLKDNPPETVRVQAIQPIEKTVVEVTPAEEVSNWFKEMDWQKGILWLLLCSGVLLMGAMAYRLYQGMNKR